jgi:tetratricopeptide (TPR) repeat protein
MQNCKILFCSILFRFALITCSAQNIDSISNKQRDSIVVEAETLMANYKFQKALDILAKADSTDIAILLRIGQCNFRLGASSAAIHPYERVLKMDSSNLTALNHLGTLYSRNGDFAKALACFKRLVEVDSFNSYHYKQAGLMAAKLGSTIHAKFWFQRALNLNPMDTEASLALGNTLMEMEQYQSVDSIVQLALAVDPRFKPLLLLKAKSEFEQKNYHSVIVTTNGLLEKSDTIALHAKLLGESYFHLGEYNKMFPWMQFLLKNQYDYEAIYFYMGVAFREVGDIPGSVEWFKLAVKKSMSVNLKIYYSELAEAFEQLGNHGEAIRALRAAYDYSKDDIFLYKLARLYDLYYKDKTTALVYYEKYLESNDTIKRTKEFARKRMQEMGKF